MSQSCSSLIRNTKGAILIEVLLSLIIFTVGITGSLALMQTSAKANAISKNRTIAINLGQEALEVAKNIRDTNWMIYSANLRECWNFSPDTNEDGDITAADDECLPNGNGQNQHPLGLRAGDGKKVRSFIVDFDADTARWFLLPAPQYLIDTGTSESFANYPASGLLPNNGEADTVVPVGGRGVQLYINNDGRYTHLPVGTESPFIRIIDICYIDNIDSGESCATSGLVPTDPDSKSSDNRIRITARVYWKNVPSEKNYHQFSIDTILTDYYQRTNWND